MIKQDVATVSGNLDEGGNERSLGVWWGSTDKSLGRRESTFWKELAACMASLKWAADEVDYVSVWSL